MMKRFVIALLALAFATPALAQWQVPNHAVAIGRGAPNIGFQNAAPGTAAQPLISTGASTNPVFGPLANAGMATMAAGTVKCNPTGGAAVPQDCTTIPGSAFPGLTGDVTAPAGSTATTLATVNVNVGSFGSATNCVTLTVNGKGLITAASQTACTPAIGSVTGLATGIATFLGTPSSANLRAAVTDETGTGLLYFQGGALGTPASGTLTNATGLPIDGGTVNTLPVSRGGTGSTTFTSGAPLLGLGTSALGTAAYSVGTVGLPLVSNSPSASAYQQISSGAISDASTAYSASVLVKRNATGGITGTNTNDNAAAGAEGEYVTASQTTPQSLTTNTALSITSVSLTAGDWDVSCVVTFVFAASTTMQTVVASTSTTTNTLGGLGQLSSFNFGSGSSITPGGGFTVPAPEFRYSLASTTTVYCVAQSGFGVSTATATSAIRARRAR